ncbi:MAG: HipA family kinase [Bacteroidota bacterium]
MDLIIPELFTIETLQKENVYPTGETPIKLRANDRAYYVTKPMRGPSDIGVVRELLAASFLKIWGLPVPDFAIINVKPEHIPQSPFLHSRLQVEHLKRPAFGSRYNEQADHASRLMQFASDYQVNLSNISGELLSIALFDMWLQNDDRNENNLNLLYSHPPNPRFIPIDHGSLFGWGEPGQSLAIQTEHDSLVYSSLFQTFVKAKSRKRYSRSAGSFADFKKSVELCKATLPKILNSSPQEWLAPLPQLQHRLEATIFTDEWLNIVWRTFTQYLHSSS